MKRLIMALFFVLVVKSFSGEIGLINGKYGINTEFDNIWICDNPIFDRDLMVERSLMRRMDSSHKDFFRNGMADGDVEIVDATRSMLHGETWFFFERSGKFMNFALRSKLVYADLMKNIVCFDVLLGGGNESDFLVNEGITMYS